MKHKSKKGTSRRESETERIQRQLRSTMVKMTQIQERFRETRRREIDFGEFNIYDLAKDHGKTNYGEYLHIKLTDGEFVFSKFPGDHKIKFTHFTSNPHELHRAASELKTLQYLIEGEEEPKQYECRRCGTKNPSASCSRCGLFS